MPVSPHVTTRLPPKGFHWNFIFGLFFENVKNIQVSLKCDKNNCTLHEDQYTFLNISSSFLLRMRNVSVGFVEKIKTHIPWSITFFFENSTFYKIMWKNIVERGRPQMAIWRIRVACWIPKATYRHSEYVIPITFPLQQWLHECYVCLSFYVLDSSHPSLWYATQL